MFNKEKKQIAMQMLQNTLTQIVQLEIINVKKPMSIEEFTKQTDPLMEHAEVLKNLIEKYDK